MTKDAEEKEIQHYRELSIPKELLELAHHDATVNTVLKSFAYGQDGYVRMLEKLVVLLAKEKKNYFDDAVDARANSLPSPIMLRPLDVNPKSHNYTKDKE